MNSESCTAAAGIDCPPTSCQKRCAIEVIDELLSLPGVITGEQADLFLDLRWQLARQDDAEEALRIFTVLRLQMEATHYLAFFRIRRWLENHLVAQIQECPESRVLTLPVKLDSYCVEAIRRQCLCRAVEQGVALLAPRLKFAFTSTVKAHAVIRREQLAASAA